jgi:hypothetical protein
MALTVADLDSLERAIARGELTATYEGKSVTFRSIEELVAAHRFVSQQLAGQGIATAVAGNVMRVSSIVYDRD